MLTSGDLAAEMSASVARRGRLRVLTGGPSTVDDDDEVTTLLALLVLKEEYKLGRLLGVLAAVDVVLYMNASRDEVC